MTAEISNLIKLQDLFHSRREKRTLRETLPPEFQDADREYREKVAAIESLQRKIEEADKARRIGESRLADFAERLKKYQGQLMGVTNSREYGAVLNEIDGVKREMRAVEDEVVALMETIEAGRQDLAAREEALPAETEAHETALSGWREMQKTMDREIEDATIQIQELEKLFPPKQLSEFYRLFERKGGHAIVRITDGSCAACHVRLRPALYQALRLSGEVVTCDSCKRILYYEEAAVATS
jgi:predicted  nucleic acid-binding Zn-ribbon protein